MQVARLAEQHVIDSSVALSDPDTLTITTPWLDAAEPPTMLARLVELIANPEFEGMRLTLCFTAGEWRGDPHGRPLREATVVIWTELREGLPRLKAAWPGSISGRGETIFHFAAWAGEDSFWKSVQRFQGTGDASDWPKKLFVSPARSALRNALRWLLVDVGEQRTLGAFLGRLAILESICVASLAAIAFVQQAPVLVLAAAPAILSLKWFVQTLIRKVRNVATRRHLMQKRMRDLYSRPLNYQMANLQDFGPSPDVNAAKYTREAEKAGFVHWRDIRTGNTGGAGSILRIFALPSERMYLYLALMNSTGTQQYFPVKAWFMSATYFTDGTRLLLTCEHGGYNKSRDPQAVQRFAPEIEDPVELLELRRPIVQRLMAEGRELAPLMSVDELLARLESDHTRFGEISRRYGYFTWGAAIRQSFHLTRPEFRAAAPKR